jgi:hypothetical protein
MIKNQIFISMNKKCEKVQFLGSFVNNTYFRSKKK